MWLKVSGYLLMLVVRGQARDLKSWLLSSDAGGERETRLETLRHNQSQRLSSEISGIQRFTPTKSPVLDSPFGHPQTRANVLLTFH